MREQIRGLISGARITLRTAVVCAGAVAVVGFLFIHDYRASVRGGPGLFWNVMHEEILFTSPCRGTIDIAALPQADPPPLPPGAKLLKPKQQAANPHAFDPSTARPVGAEIPPPPPGYTIIPPAKEQAWPGHPVSPSDVTMPDGTLITNVPAATTQHELAGRYEKWKADHVYERSVCGWEIPYRWLLAAMVLFVAGVAVIKKLVDRKRMDGPSLASRTRTCARAGA